VAGLALLASVLAAGLWLRAASTEPPTPAQGLDDSPTVFHPANPVPAQEPLAVTPGQPDPQPTAATQTDLDKKPKPKPSGPNASALTRALRKQRTKLEGCFMNHSVALEGHATTQLIFDLAEDGTLTRVELSPKPLTQTELGQCLLNIARSTRFPPQPRAVSFTIPLTASTSRQ
jgi:outer membrane biosynthesis protein TonB